MTTPDPRLVAALNPAGRRPVRRVPAWVALVSDLYLIIKVPLVMLFVGLATLPLADTMWTK